MVILGKYEPATDAPFESSISYRQGTLANDRVKIATTRRLNQPKEKANSSDFVVEAIAKDERQKLQQTLGLGKSLVDTETLVNAYQQRGGTDNLRQLLQMSNTQQKMSEGQLIQWIQQWQKINHI